MKTLIMVLVLSVSLCSGCTGMGPNATTESTRRSIDSVSDKLTESGLEDTMQAFGWGMASELMQLGGSAGLKYKYVTGKLQNVDPGDSGDDFLYSLPGDLIVGNEEKAGEWTSVTLTIALGIKDDNISGIVVVFNGKMVAYTDDSGNFIRTWEE